MQTSVSTMTKHLKCQVDIEVLVYACGKICTLGKECTEGFSRYSKIVAIRGIVNQGDTKGTFFLQKNHISDL